MKRLPRIDITNEGDVLYATIRRRVVAFMWRVAEYWYVAAPGHMARNFTSQRDAMRTLLDLATRENQSRAAEFTRKEGGS